MSALARRRGSRPVVVAWRRMAPATRVARPASRAVAWRCADWDLTRAGSRANASWSFATVRRRRDRGSALSCSTPILTLTKAFLDAEATAVLGLAHAHDSHH